MSNLQDKDWIVHLDEETLLTDSSVKGIINFINEGKHQFGQGLITYANEKVSLYYLMRVMLLVTSQHLFFPLQIENYFLTLCDTLRVAEDMGKIQFQLRVLHMPLFGWKGSFVVSQVNC